MKLFTRKKKEQYWSKHEIDSTNAVYRMVIGQRSNGKTYGTMRDVIKDFIENEKPSAYIRRYAEEIRPKFLQDLLTPHSDYIKKLSKGQWNSTYYRTNNFYLCRRDKNGDIVEKDGNPCLFALALNTWNTAKGADRGELNYIVFDEFMTRDGYLRDEFATFANIISSLVRDREIKCIYMLANTVNKYCPYFEEMGLTHIPDQEQGTIELYTYNNEKLTVAVEYCATAEATKDVEHYYAFDNPQLDMITTGNWEEAKYKRIEKTDFEMNEHTLKGRFLVRFNHKEVVGEIHKDREEIFVFYHWLGGSQYKWGRRDIIYTDEPILSVLHSNTFNNNQTHMHVLIASLMRSGHDYYASNSVGEVINNFKKYGG